MTLGDSLWAYVFTARGGGVTRGFSCRQQKEASGGRRKDFKFKNP